MNGIEQLKEVPLVLLVSLACLALLQGSWLFINARKYSSRPWHAWLWGIWGLTNVPTPLLVYLLVVRKIHLRLRRGR